MIEYLLNGAWGKVIPDEKLKKTLSDFGIELEVEARRDGLSNVKIKIDDEKILKRRKRSRTVSKKDTTEDAAPIEKEKKITTKKVEKRF